MYILLQLCVQYCQIHIRLYQIDTSQHTLQYYLNESKDTVNLEVSSHIVPVDTLKNTLGFNHKILESESNA